jgi:DNA-binding NtrC family response regulator
MNFSAGRSTGNEGIYWLDQILKRDAEISVVMITAYGDIELAVKSMKLGASDFIQKSWDENKILSTILSVYKLRKSRQEVKLLKKKKDHLNYEIGRKLEVCRCPSVPMKKIYEILDKTAPTDANILILGENGTGKEIIAHEIHLKSNRAEELFVKVDLGAIPETLFESELFGHLKGSFTDAREDRTGRMEIATGGTLFLDEIGNIPPAMQSKLLSALQNKEIYPLGSSKPLKTDIRLITATNMPLEEISNSENFRKDLLYRINTIQIEIPPLRERKDDIPVLAEFFLRKYIQQYKKERLNIPDKIMTQLIRHNWPGNIRELEHHIEKMVILSEGRQMPDLSFFPGSKTMNLNRGTDTFDLEENEKWLIREALGKFDGNISLTAKKLGIDRSTLYAKMKKYEIKQV